MYRDRLIRLITRSACAIICTGVISVYAQEDAASIQDLTDPLSTPGYHLAQANEQDKQVQPPSGTLILPDSYSQGKDDNAGKKCMTVCARWGEECTYVNRGTAGTTRNCRRTCQQFTEECF